MVMVTVMVMVMVMVRNIGVKLDLSLLPIQLSKIPGYVGREPLPRVARLKADIGGCAANAGFVLHSGHSHAAQRKAALSLSYR